MPQPAIPRISLVLAALVAASGARADTFTVSSSDDAGAGSLRDAIVQANATVVSGGTACAAHAIVFAIAGAGPHTIRPRSPLPPLEVPVVLNGYSQPGAQTNTLDQGNNAVLRIELDGSLAGVSANGIVMTRGPTCSGASQVSGLVLNRWGGAAIRVVGTPTHAIGGARIWGNFIGTDVTGRIALGNGGAGRGAIEFGPNTAFNIVGEAIVGEDGQVVPQPSTRNLIAGNAGYGILVSGTDALRAAQVRVRNAYVGTTAAGTAALPNGGGVLFGAGSADARLHDSIVSGNATDGVVILDNLTGFATLLNNRIGVGVGGVALGNGGHGVRAGGLAADVTIGGNGGRISHNGGAGLFVEDLARVNVNGGVFSDNAGLGIDLAPEGVDPIGPGDRQGPNEGLDYPVLTAATYQASSASGRIEGWLQSVPDADLTVEFYVNDRCDPSGHGQGQQILRQSGLPVSVEVRTDAAGHARFSRAVAFGPPLGQFVTAFARMRASPPPAGGPGPWVVSEFSACRQVQPPPVDPIFSDGFEGR